jgi:hypothetical protein
MTIHEQLKEARAKYLYAVLMLENKMEDWERKEYQQVKDDNLKKIVDLIDLLEPTLETILSAELKQKQVQDREVSEQRYEREFKAMEGGTDGG